MSTDRLRRLRRLLAGIALSAVLVTGAWSGPAGADSDDGGGSKDNAAVAVNTRDGASVWRIAFSVRRIVDGQVDPTNAAVAYSSCERCQTVAIAIQVVLVSGDATTVAPTNVAIAVNDQCTECETYAAAYQFVFADGRDLRLSAEGRRRIADLRKRLQALRRQDLDTFALAQQVGALVDELRTVLRTELEPRPADDDGDDDADDDRDDAGEGGDGSGGSTTTTSAPGSSSTSTTAASTTTTVGAASSTTTTAAP